LFDEEQPHPQQPSCPQTSVLSEEDKEPRLKE